MSTTHWCRTIGAAVAIAAVAITSGAQEFAAVIEITERCWRHVTVTGAIAVYMTGRDVTLGWLLRSAATDRALQARLSFVGYDAI